MKLKHRGNDTKFIARVLSVGPECDLALLTVDDDAFWEGVVPVKLGASAFSALTLSLPPPGDAWRRRSQRR